jgi:peptide/nickel transport system substrate-binding protein
MMRIFPRCLLLLLVALQGFAQPNESEIRMSIRADPKTFDPLLALDDPSEAVRYMTGGVLVRFNRIEHKMEPELAESWRQSTDGRRIDFVLKKGIRFSDGTPFDSADVAAAIARINDRSLRSGIADTFRGEKGSIQVETKSPDRVSLTFPAPITGMLSLFDQLAFRSTRSKQPDKAFLGPYTVSDYKPGQYVLLQRNPNYWKKDKQGRRLPHTDKVRLDILASRDIELSRFRNGELDVIDKVEPDVFDRLKKQMPESVKDVGPSLDPEFVWFNQVPNAPIPAHKKKWFASQRFRRAISSAINRADLARVVYHGYARPAAAYISESNRAWWHSGLTPHPFEPSQALRSLREDGFRTNGGKLVDKDGNAVEFSLITNSSSRSRTQMAAMLQHDLNEIGIQLNVVPLEFGSLIERITQTNNYEACLLGYTNVEPEPNTQVNVFLSSGNLHAWYPGQQSPATPWEAEIDQLIRKQAGAPQKLRKRELDRVQEILWKESPLIFLVHPNVLVAVSPELTNVALSPLPPRFYWNIEQIQTNRKSARR